MSLPTKEELCVVETFRGKVTDILAEEEVSDDMFLLRWLRARDLDLEKAETMLRNAIKWRKDNKVDGLIIGKSSKPFYYENFPKFCDGIDHEGRPVYCAQFGKWDVRKVVRQGKSEEFISYLTECFEECSKAIKASAALHPPKNPGHPPITQMVAIYDWEGFAWSQLFSYQTVQSFLQIGAIYEAYYPEILHSCYFINCPSLISTVLMLLKPVIAPKTMDKIKCFGDKKGWREEMLKHIDANQLRPQFGGTKDNNENPFK